ncbi:flavodoxin family protein [Candidatus Falkowbacteria bacterium]|nr:flavodoxin family protein [Candidatus Falkowbacteria bacterium]
MKKKILVILGHPQKKSFCGSLAERYMEGAKRRGHVVKFLALGDIKFNPILESGYSKVQELEPDLKKAQDMIKWAQHLTFIYPIWWANLPALLKGFIERSFLPGFAYKFRGHSIWWDKYLRGKSARIMATSDSPPLFYKLIVGDPDYKSLKDTLKFCGVSPIDKDYFGSIKRVSQGKRNRWLKRAYKLGKKE